MSDRRDAVEQVRHRSDIVEVIGDHVALRQAGRNYVGLCPFHEERTPSFSVSPDKQMFYCFGCQTGGDVFQFIMLKENVDFREALSRLARRAGVSLPERRMTPEERRRWERFKQLYEVLDAAARFFQEQLQSPAGAAARHHLEKRGISRDTIDEFRIGWAPAGWDGLIKAAAPRFSAEVLTEAGLAAPARSRDGYYDRFRGRIMFPIEDGRGRIIGFGGRILEDAEGTAKYLNSPETPVFKKRETWYALHRARGAIRGGGRVLVVEGYTDAIACHRHGVDYAVASLGTALSEEQARILARQARQVIVAFDADAAGRAATIRGMDHFRRYPDLDLRVLELPRGSDPDDFVRRHGADEFTAAIDGAKSYVRWRFDLSRRRHDASTVDGKVKITEEVAPLVAGLGNAVARAGYVRQFARELKVPEEALWEEVGRLRRRRSGGHGGKGSRRQFDVFRRTGQGKAPGGRKEYGVTGAPPPGTGGGWHKRANRRDNNTGPARGAVTAGQKSKIEAPSRFERAEQALLGVLLGRPDLGSEVWGVLSPENFAPGATRELAEALARAHQEQNASEDRQTGMTANKENLQHTVMGRLVSDEGRRLLARISVEESFSEGDRGSGSADAAGTVQGLGPEEAVRELVAVVQLGHVERERRALIEIIRQHEAAGENIDAEILRNFDELARSHEELQGRLRSSGIS